MAPSPRGAIGVEVRDNGAVEKSLLGACAACQVPCLHGPRRRGRLACPSAGGLQLSIDMHTRGFAARKHGTRRFHGTRQASDRPPRLHRFFVGFAAPGSTQAPGPTSCVV